MKKALKLILFVATAMSLSACGGSYSEIAQGVLYPFDKVNQKYAVPEIAPDNLSTHIFEVNAADGTRMKINAWSYKAPNANARAFVYLHGNGENLQALYVSNFINRFKQLGVHFIIIDYPGLGRSTGYPNEENLVNSALAAVNWAERVHSRSPLVVWGRSLGAAVAVQVAARLKPNQIQGLMLTSGWNNFYEAALALSKLAKKIPQEWLAQNTYDSAGAAATTKVITLMHHGALDKLIPLRLGKKLFEAFPQGNAELVELADKEHNDIFQDQQLWQDAGGFIR